ncbi:ABC-type dipeptide/oligopeptide/nickel transport system, permease component [Burkholderiales bacterium]|nr:ABC-type dipeptide/oligopeptide/nickel transport system, permease component [Burkholderiales bacterium]
MSAYLLRRVAYALAVLLGVNLVTFVLFFAINTPDDQARLQLGRRVTAEAIERWKAEHGYDRPLFYNPVARGLAQATDTVFFDTSRRAAIFDFGRTNEGVNIGEEIRQRIVPSLLIGIQVFVLAIGAAVLLALGMALFRATRLDAAGVALLVAMMSISTLFYIIVGQFVVGRVLQLTPISGFAPGGGAEAFLVLPIIVLIVSYLGPEARLFRTIFLEELGKDYVRTARAKGLSEWVVLGRHVLRNSLIPIVTSSGAMLPAVITSTIVTETFFAIPGLGNFTIEGITQQDFGIVRAMVFVGSVLYIVSYLLVDIIYTMVDPRIRLQ